ncbi:uncharacterized protein LOC116178868 [Photinus pyralis]|nr:uncharacterized protein LOC116178848 [Photinus pyralis]XP_031354359.1 uncharacterized protein LOC116178868 [Photinus pyralis]
MPSIPEGILDKLTCVQCHEWLSCGPIRLLPNGGSICGRCPRFEGPRDQYRHFAFEALACYFKFPCRNWGDGCQEWMPFKGVMNHEKNCSYGSTCSVLCCHPLAFIKSKRHLDAHSAIKLEIIPDGVLEYLRCTNCAGYLSYTPIYVCRDGTSICQRCTSQLPQPDGEFIRDFSFERFVDMMIFPCIYRYRGCTLLFKFGQEMKNHELDCPYGKPYKREPTAPKSDPQEDIQRKGVIKTLSGHIYATITPNAPLFAAPSTSNKEQQALFLDEFQKHRENLSSKWGRYNEDDYQNEYVNQVTHLNVIDELKIKQQYRNSSGNNGDMNAYYNHTEAQKADYSVYNQRA